MKRIAILSAAMGLMGAMANAGRDIVTIERARPVSGKRIRIALSKRQKRSSRYMPHQGAKERERAKRCHLSHWLNERVATFHPRDGHLRTSPTLCQMSKCQYEANFREVY